MLTRTENRLHIHDGKRSINVPLVEMELDNTATDHDIRRAVALMLELPVRTLRSYAVVRDADGDITLQLSNLSER